MKKIILAAFLLISAVSFGQIRYTDMSFPGYQFKYMKADSLLHVPVGDTLVGRGVTRPGAIKIYSADSLLYFWNGRKWGKVSAGGGGGSTDTASLSNRINLKADQTALVDTAAAIRASILPLILSNKDTFHIRDADTNFLKAVQIAPHFWELRAYLKTINDSSLYGTGNLVISGTDTTNITAIHPLRVLQTMGASPVDSALMILKADSTKSGYVDSIHWKRFYDHTDTAYRYIVSNGIGLLSVAQNNKGFKLSNYTPSTASLNQKSPAIVFRNSYWNATVSAPIWWKINVDPISGGVLYFDRSIDSVTWSNKMRIDINGGVIASSFSGTSFGGAAQYSNSNFILNALGVQSLGANSITNSYAQLELKSISKGLLLSRLTTAQKRKISGNIVTATITTPGSGYTNGSYVNTAVTGGSGTGQTWNITVAGGVVTTLSNFAINSGQDYKVGDVVSSTITGGSGFTATVTSISASQARGIVLYDSTLNFTQTFDGVEWIETSLNKTNLETKLTGETFTAKIGGNIVEAAGTLADLTIALPTVEDGSICQFSFPETLTAITWTGGTLRSAITTATAGTAIKLKYNKTQNKWYVF